jgi:hypothetical protein
MKSCCARLASIQMGRIRRQATRLTARATSEKPSYFLSFSTGEAHIGLFAECLELVFGNQFVLKRTPEVLESDNSQHDSIFELIRECSFGVVCLDGLRPNVLFEYGIMRGARLPILLFKEDSATVDVAHLYGPSNIAIRDGLPTCPLAPVSRIFSDIQDRFYVGWSRYEVRKTMATIWEQYKMKKNQIKDGSIDVPDPTKASS